MTERSRPSRALAVSSAAVLGIVSALPFTPLAGWLGLGHLAPGTVLAWFPVAPPAPPPDDHGGLASFVTVCCRFTDIEALSLHATGHERVVLRLDGPAATREIRAP